MNRRTSNVLLTCAITAAICLGTWGYSRPEGPPRESAETEWIIEARAFSVGTNLNDEVFAPATLAGHNAAHFPTVLLNHDAEQLIGRVIAARVEDDALLITIRLSKSRPDIWQLVREGVLSGVSIGFRAFPADQEPTWLDKRQVDGVILRRIIIVEISFVAIPADPTARILRWYERAK